MFFPRSFKILYLFFFLFFSFIPLYAGYINVSLVGPDFVKFKLDLDVSSPSREYKVTLYRNDTSLHTFTGYSVDGHEEFDYTDETPGGEINTYKLYDCYKDDGDEDWTCSFGSIHEVDSSVLNGIVDLDIEIDGEWKIGELKLVGDINVSVKDAYLINNGYFLCDTDYTGTITVDNTTFTDVSITAYNNLVKHRVNITNSTFETQDVTYAPKLTFISLEKFSNNQGSLTIQDCDGVSVFSSNDLLSSSISFIGSTAGLLFEDNTFRGSNIGLKANSRMDINRNNFTAYYVADLDYYFYSSLSVYSDDQYRSSLYVSENNSSESFYLTAPYIYANDNNLSSLVVYGIEDGSVDNNLLGQLYIQNSSNVEVKQNILGSDEYYSSLAIYADKFLNVTENNISCSKTKYRDYGINIQALEDSTISKNIIDGEECTYSVRFSDNGYSDSSNLAFKNNMVYDNVFASKGSAELAGCLQDNTIYNNIFAGEVNYDLWIDSSIECNGTVAHNDWNVEKKVGPNIVGGPMIGGNYWKVRSAMSSDKDGDGFLDSPISLYIHADSNTTVYDNLALSYNPLTLSPATSNPSEGIWSQATGIMKVLHFKLTNSPLSDFNAIVSSLEFQFTGSSDASADDIESVTLYDDPKCSMDENAVSLGSQTFSNNLATFATNIILNQGTERCFYLEYKIKDVVVAKIVQNMVTQSADEYCPCALYGATLNAEDMSATANGISTRFVGEVEGSINAGWPTISYKDVDTKDRLAGKNTVLSAPLEVLLSEFKSSCVDQWQAEYTIVSVPDGATGQELISDNIHANTVTTNFVNGVAGVEFQTGNKAGEYVIDVKPKPTIQICPDATTVPSLRFSVSIGGVKLLADLDGSDGGSEDMSISTFITTIEAKNNFTAEVELPDWAGDAKEVKFTPSWTTSISDTTEPFNAEFDMATLKENSTMTVTAVAQDNQEFSEVYTFNAIVLPTWVETFNGAPYEGITWKFSKDIKSYELDFSFPDDFIWKNPIPDDIALIGGEENEQGLSIKASAFYNIDRSSAFTGAGEFSGELFGKPIEVKGSMRADFDEQFAIKASPAPYADFSAKIEFDLGSKTLASKTIIVYGVPVTVSVDVGGNVEVFAEGKLVFSRQLKIDKATFIPGSTITITIDASASAAFGLAKIGIKAEPQGTVQIKLTYTTVNASVTQEQFGGAFSVPVTIYGSLFWGTISGDLGSTEFGPWKFGDDVSMSTLNKVSPLDVSTDKKFYSTSASASNDDGSVIRVFTVDRGGATDINPEVSSSLGDITSNTLWEIDPDVTYLSGSNVLAIWTSNDGEKTLNNLGDILNHQDIAVSIYNGNSWSVPQLLIDDEFSDGTPKVAYDSTAQKALAIWTHNASQDIDSITGAKTNFELYYATYDENTNSWSNASALSFTDDNGFDFAPSVTSLHDGTFMAVWIKDDDGKLFTKLPSMSGGSDVNKTNSDANVLYSIYEPTSGSWSNPSAITPQDYQTELMPVVDATSDFVVAVWVVKALDNTQVLYLSEYKSGSWSQPREIDRASYVIEDPSVIIENSYAHVFYRRMDGTENGLYEIVEPLRVTVSDTFDTTPQKIADGTIMWNSVVKDSGGNTQLSWTDPSKTQTLATASINTVPDAELNSTSTQGVEEVDKRFRYLEFKANINIVNANDFAIKATLVTPSGNTVETLTSAKISLDAGDKELKLDFSGSKINATKESGIYTIKNIELIEYTPDGVIIDSIPSINTISIDVDEFALALLQLDDDNYQVSKPMVITLSDTNLTTAPSVTINSSDGGSIVVALDGVDGNYTKTIELEGSGLTVENGSIIGVEYIDKDLNIWSESVVWLVAPTPDYTLSIPSGWSMISPPVDALTPIDDIFKDVDVVWSYSGGVWSAWSPDAQILQTLQDDGIKIISQIEIGKGYYVNSSLAHSVDIYSSEWSISNLSLSSGWNLVGFSKDTTADELFSVISDIDIVWCLKDTGWAGVSPDDNINNSIESHGYELLVDITKAQACFIYIK